MSLFSEGVRRYPLFLLVLSFLSACTITGSPTSTPPRPDFADASSDTGVRQTDDSGRRLPFITQFPRRWNSGNDGTSYEPCTAATPQILGDTGLQPESARDAAAADFQTARGCIWSFTSFKLASLSQVVGDFQGLDAYKQKHANITEWRANTEINNRPVAVGSTKDRSTCETYVESGIAIVSTSTAFTVDPPPINEICDKAIAFTRATIAQMPE
ncbi:DUF3558 family protein [Gordonia sputi]